MDNLSQLQVYSTELTAAITSFSNHTQNSTSPQSSGPQIASNLEEVQRARESILSILTKIRALLWTPTEFLQHLGSQSRILASLQWLGENQILACIPLAESVPIRDIADLTGVSAAQLSRTIRLTATVGFLSEPETAHVAHTQLSAPFSSNPSLLDAAIFLSEFVAPATLHIAGKCNKQPITDKNVRCPSLSLDVISERRPKLRRQWTAYLYHVGGLCTAKDVAAVLTQLNWEKISNVPNTCIVEVNAQSSSSSIAQCLIEQYPTLHFSVQIPDRGPSTAPERMQESFNPRVTVTDRTPATRQTVSDATVYILHLPSAALQDVRNELMGHLDALRTRGSILIILTARLLPEPNSPSNPEVETVARSRDVALQQLTNEAEMEMDELLEIIKTVKDERGKLTVARKLCARNGLVVALVVKYQGQCMQEL